MKAGLFDMDGVIVDSNPYHKKAWQRYAKQLGFELETEEDFKSKVYGKTNEEILYAFFGEDLDKERAYAMAEEKEALFRDIYAPHIVLPDGLVDLLENFKAEGVSAGVATNAPKSNLDFVLDTLNIRSYFQEVIYARLVEKPKPDPSIYLKLASMLGADPSQCIVFEDSLPGVEAGYRAGAKVAAITSTYGKEELEETGQTALIFHSFFEISTSDLRNLVEGK